MRILHTADLHIGQILYNNYERSSEHDHFFAQLRRWCVEHQPDALLVSGDVFNITCPNAQVKASFNRHFASLHKLLPEMKIIVTAGNHDSASRLEADTAIWDLAGVVMVGMAPPADASLRGVDWQRRFVVELDGGWVIALPFMVGERPEMLQELLDYVAQRNDEQKPVVMMGHCAVDGCDETGHEIGKMRTQTIASLGEGYDYVALGHIHRSQTLGCPIDDEYTPETIYAQPVVRYSGSALHVSSDEKYPHSVSLVDMETHGGPIRVRRLRIDELFHFHELPYDHSALSVDEALDAVRQLVQQEGSAYFRLRLDASVVLPPDFDQLVYAIIDPTEGRVRYNPRTIWTGAVEKTDTLARPTFDIATLQQMDDPFVFVRDTIAQYPELNLDDLKADFQLVAEEIGAMREAEAAKSTAKSAKSQNEPSEQE